MTATVRSVAVVLAGLLLVPGFARAGRLDGLVAYYPFSGNANDATSNGNDGTAHGTSLVRDIFGNLASAYHFDGSQYIDAPNPAALLSGSALTVSAWVYLDRITAGTMQVVQKDSADLDSLPNAFGMTILGTGNCSGDNCVSTSRFGLTLNIGGAYYSGAWSAAVLEAGRWYHLAATYDNSKVVLWVNGSPDSVYALTGNFASNGDALNIGRLASRDSNYFQGTIDEVMIYNRALSGEEIDDLSDVPEPATLGLLCAGIAGLAVLRRRR
jgi:hypothetical protein